MSEKDRDLKDEKDSLREMYVSRFWEKHNPETYLPTMKDIVSEALLSRRQQISRPVNPDGIDEQDREWLAAYEQIAIDLGYTISEWKHLQGQSHAAAKITKIVI